MTDDTEEQAETVARALLDRLGTERKKLEDRLEGVQKETHDAIVDILMARTLGPSEVARRVQYDRQHVARIAKKAGVPPLREATVVSRAKAAPPPPTAAVQPAPSQRPAGPRLAPAPTSRPPREPRPTAPVVPMGDERATQLAALAQERATPAQLQALEQQTGHVGESSRPFAVVAAALGMGLLTQEEIDTEGAE